jgi:hypothetical protein
MFATKFDDFGKTYTQGTRLEKNQDTNVIIIFKVDKKLDKKRFVLYYQDNAEEKPTLKKIKIKLNDVSIIKDNGLYSLGKEIKYNYVKDGKELTEKLSPDSFAIKKSISFVTNDCDGDDCSIETKKVTAKTGYRIVEISYMTEDFEGKDIIDFSSKYGKINYIDSNNNKQSVDMKNITEYDYLGQYAYVEVPEDIEKSSSIDLIYTVRNNRYTFRVKG